MKKEIRYKKEKNVQKQYDSIAKTPLKLIILEAPLVPGPAKWISTQILIVYACHAVGAEQRRALHAGARVGAAAAAQHLRVGAVQRAERAQTRLPVRADSNIVIARARARGGAGAALARAHGLQVA